MTLSIVRCPGCNAGLRATTPGGFAEGHTLTCPKCQTMFAVEAEAPPATAKPAPRKAAVIIDDDDEEAVRPKKKRPRDDDEEDDRPRKKKNRDDDEEGFRYAKSPIRIVVISILLVILAVLSVLLYLKWKRESEEKKSTAEAAGIVWFV